MGMYLAMSFELLFLFLETLVHSNKSTQLLQDPGEKLPRNQIFKFKFHRLYKIPIEPISLYCIMYNQDTLYHQDTLCNRDILCNQDTLCNRDILCNQDPCIIRTHCVIRTPV